MITDPIADLSSEELVDANIVQLLKIIRDKLHLDPFTPVREYISNARDATRDMADPRISVWGDGLKLHIQDNGKGMTKKVITEGFTRIGGHIDAHGERITPVGRQVGARIANNAGSIGSFGVGCKSAFMAALRLVVETRSEQEPHGWRIEWERDAIRYKLTPIEREEVGTHAVLHIEPSKRMLAANAELRGKIARIFAMLPIPIHLGNSTPINTHWQWVVDQSKARENPRLLFDRESIDLLKQFTLEDPKVAYISIDESGTRFLLGIPERDHLTLDGHKVAFFSQGVLIQPSAMNFFPEQLSFIVGIVDCPKFNVRLDREDIGKDEVYDQIRDSIEKHILTFLDMVGRKNPGLMEEILRTHRTKLMAHARVAPSLRRLFREHYRFDTSAGRILWKDILAFAPEQAPELGGRTIHALNSSQGDEYLSQSRSEGLLTVFASGTEFELLKEIANEHGVTVLLGSEIPDGDVPVPPPFQKLGAKLGVKLNYRGSWGVTFVNFPGDNSKPALFRVRTVKDIQVGDRDSTDGETMISVDALMINVAHPLIRRLAGMVDNLSDEQLAGAADVLFQSAVLNSRFRDAASLISNDVIANLVRLYGAQLDGQGGSTPPLAADDGVVKCFVAFPFADEFRRVFDGANLMLGQPPYTWELIRADHHVAGVGLLTNLQNMIKSGQRFLADISGLNSNVMIELGMMIRQDRHATVILCDRETYAKNIPADLKGEILAIYDSDCRSSPERFEAWFRKEIWKFNNFLAISSSPTKTARASTPSTRVLSHA